MKKTKFIALFLFNSVTVFSLGNTVNPAVIQPPVVQPDATQPNVAPQVPSPVAPAPQPVIPPQYPQYPQYPPQYPQYPIGIDPSIMQGMLPPNVLAYIQSTYPGVPIYKVEREFWGYEVKLMNGLELKFSGSGQLLGIEFDD